MSEALPTTASSAAQAAFIPNSPLGFIWYITRDYRWLSLGAVIAVLIAQAAELAELYAISQLVDQFNLAETKAEQLDILVFWGAIFLLLGVVDRVGWRTSGFAGVALAIKADKAAYQELYQYITKHSHSYFINRFAGALSNKISHAAGNSADLIMRTVWDIFPQSVTLLVTLWLFAAIHWVVGLIFLIILLAVLTLNVWWVKKRRPLVFAYAEATSKMRGHSVDVLTNISAVRQYSRRNEELTAFNRVLTDRLQKDFKQAYRGEWLMVINGALGVLLMGAVLGTVYILLTRELATAGQLVLVLLLLGRIGFSFNIMGNIMNGFVRRYGEIDEGLKEIIVPHDIEDSMGAQPLKISGGKIEWQKVSFVYGKNRVFSEFNLTIQPGQRVGLVGPSGAGKSTFVSLLLRQHDIEAGEILIDGQNIAQVTQDSLRQAIAVVPQEPLLFHRSIRENIAYGKPNASENELREVAMKAQALEFIEALPDGFETLVGERGVKLSGGQKQRVAIARAMLKDAPILVLDEATSALDSESEVEIQKALHQLMVGKTVIAIAHRLSTLREMDRIVVMDRGQIVEDGSHEALLQYGGVYAKLWQHQAGGFLQEASSPATHDLSIT